MDALRTAVDGLNRLRCQQPMGRVLSYLRAHKKGSLVDAVTYLKQMSLCRDAAEILRNIAPERMARLHSAEPEDLLHATLEEINAIAPLWLDVMLEDLNMDDVVYQLQPESCGYPISWDEWEEIAQDPTDCSDDMGLYVFFTAVRLGYAQTLLTASERWGWELECFPNVSISLDWEQLKTALEAAGLGVFYQAAQVIDHSTDNLYFDFNPYDQDALYGDELPAFTLEGVLDLEREWQEARPMLADLNSAIEIFRRDRSIASRLMECILSSQFGNDDYRPVTLAEMWADDEPDEEDLEIRVRL